MFYFKYSPQNKHLHEYEAHMHMRFITGQYKAVWCKDKKLKVCKFFNSQDKEWTYFIIDPNVAKTFIPIPSKESNKAVHGFVALSKLRKGIALVVEMSYVNPDLRGKGIAQLLYDSILKDGNVIVSGATQSSKAKRFWLKLINNKEYTVWAQDLMNSARVSAVTIDDRNMICDLKLYKDIKIKRRKQTEDIRLIAVINPRRARNV